MAPCYMVFVVCMDGGAAWSHGSLLGGGIVIVVLALPAGPHTAVASTPVTTFQLGLTRPTAGRQIIVLLSPLAGTLNYLTE